MADYDSALVALTAEVARAYTVIRTFQVLVAEARANADLQAEGLRIAEARFRNGATSELDVTQATALLESTRATIPTLETGRAQAEHALSTLLGQPVGSLEALLAVGSFVGVATHDEALIQSALTRVAGLGHGAYEFQMLLGVRARLGDELVREGHRLRIYTPFGRHWYSYSLRRLQENPKIAGYIATDTFNRLLPGRNGSS